jgi:UDPglucose--hexose-1-phosphate uridylyltransferase
VPELRVDPLTGLRVLVAPDRSDRPGGLPEVAPPPPVDPSEDPFAAGREDLTPPTLLRLDGPDGRWRVRAFANLYPAVVPDAPEPERDARPDLFGVLPARGSHEVIVHAPDPVVSLAQVDATQAELAVQAWRARMRHHAEAGAAYVHLHVNERPEGGASQAHAHAQLTALGFVPADIARERERYGAYAARTMGQDLLQDLLQEEVRRRRRLVAVDDEAVLLAPFASRVPFQLMLVPRRPAAAFQEEGQGGARLLHDGLRRLAARFGAPPPLTLWVRTAPSGAERFGWRIDILPRLVPLAGLELGTGVFLNPVAPERAAAELREVLG